jgi:hypothetical protein
VAGGYLSNSRHRLDWPAAGDALSRAEAKLLLLMLLTAMTATPIGGTLRVAPPEAAPLRLSIRAEGRRAGLSPETERLVMAAPGAQPEVPREAHLAVLGRHAAQLGVKVSIRPDGEEAVVIEAVEP